MSFGRSYATPTEAHVDLTPKPKEFWNSTTVREKDSILCSARETHKPKPPFARKESESIIKTFIYQCLAFDEDLIAKDYNRYEESTEQDASLLVDYETAKKIIQMIFVSSYL